MDTTGFLTEGHYADQLDPLQALASIVSSRLPMSCSSCLTSASVLDIKSGSLCSNQQQSTWTIPSHSVSVAKRCNHIVIFDINLTSCTALIHFAQPPASAAAATALQTAQVSQLNLTARDVPKFTLTKHRLTSSFFKPSLAFFSLSTTFLALAAACTHACFMHLSNQNHSAAVHLSPGTHGRSTASDAEGVPACCIMISTAPLYLAPCPRGHA